MIASTKPPRAGCPGTLTGGGFRHLPIFLGHASSSRRNGSAAGIVPASPTARTMAHAVRAADSANPSTLSSPMQPALLACGQTVADGPGLIERKDWRALPQVAISQLQFRDRACFGDKTLLDAIDVTHAELHKCTGRRNLNLALVTGDDATRALEGLDPLLAPAKRTVRQQDCSRRQRHPGGEVWVAARAPSLLWAETKDRATS